MRTKEEIRCLWNAVRNLQGRLHAVDGDEGPGEVYLSPARKTLSGRVSELEVRTAGGEPPNGVIRLGSVPAGRRVRWCDAVYQCLGWTSEGSRVLENAEGCILFSRSVDASVTLLPEGEDHRKVGESA